MNNNVIRTWYTTFFLAIVACVVVAATRPAPTEAFDIPVKVAPDLGKRIPLTYWATPSELAAYQFICDGKRHYEKLAITDDTTPYSPSNGLQVLVGPVFAGWIDIQAQAKRNEVINELTLKLQNVSDADLRLIKNMVNSVSPTNPPSLPP